jgi:hypothetical protein
MNDDLDLLLAILLECLRLAVRLRVWRWFRWRKGG